MSEVGGDDIIALSKSKQSAFAKAVKRVKKSKVKEEGDVQAQKGQRGIIMLKHIPHGFYEKEMKSYFSQFGKVLRVRVGRSQKTGKSRGYAFVEFEFQEVAKIAAEAMNNYLMFERLIKCEIVSSDIDPKKLFRLKYIRDNNYPKLSARKAAKAKRDLELTEEEGKDILQQRLNKIKEQNKRLAELGIEYEFKVAKTEGEEEASESGIEENEAEDDDVADSDNDEDSEQDDNMEVDSNDDDESEEDNDSALEDIASLFPTPIKTKLASPEVANVTQKTKTPLQNKFSPKLLRSRKSQGVPTPAVDTKSTPGKKARVSELPRISLKLLRSRKSQGQSLQTPEIKNSQTPSKKQNLQASTPQSKSAPTPKKKDKTLEFPTTSPTPKNKKSKGPNVQTPASETNKTPGKKTKPTDLPKISPKLLRSRKSEAVLTPLKEKTPAKAKKGGRKSVL